MPVLVPRDFVRQWWARTDERHLAFQHIPELRQFVEARPSQEVSDRVAALVEQYQPRVLALDMSRVPDIEYSALQALMQGEKRATEHGAVFWLVGLNPGALEVVRNAGLYERLGRERMLFNARAAIARYQALQASAGGVAQPTSS